VNNRMEVHKRESEPWRVTLVDTGEKTMTGGRLKRVAKYVEGEEAFCFTYGDGLADINISALVKFHKVHGRLATITAVQPPGRYGAIIKNNGSVQGFQEKPPGDGSWINGGFFVLNPKVIDLIDDDRSHWEGGALERLASGGQLEAFEHKGFWQPMDTLRDKNALELLWMSDHAPWKCWE
jgi:glucose-1-phosphate cytidylyltransferase